MGFAGKHWLALGIVLIVGYWLGTRGTFGHLPFIGGAAAPTAG